MCKDTSRTEINEGFYPEVKIPLKIALPPLIPEEPEKPLKPKPPDPPKSTGCMAETISKFAAFSLGFIFLILASENLGGIGLAIGLVIFLIFVGTINDRFESDEEEKAIAYQKKQEEYQNEFLKYSEDYENYIREKNRILDLQAGLNSGRIDKEEQRKNRRIEYTLASRTPKQQEKVVSEGRGENFFFDYLKSYFGEKIFSDLVFPNMSHQRPFYPDFVYWDQQTNFCIDIEIDEPYSSKDFSPIHYLNSPSDENRYEEFISGYWTIIRFSEEQIFQNPKGCCQIVEKIINDLFNKNSVPINLEDFINIHSKWTQEEAIYMANNNYRNSYLPQEKQILPGNLNKNAFMEDDKSDDLPF